MILGMKNSNEDGEVPEPYRFSTIENVNAIVESITELLMSLLLCVLIAPSHLHPNT